MDSKRVKVSYADAVAMLPPDGSVHTFRNGSGVLLGADWDRTELLLWIEKHGVELTGEIATRMNHGLVGFDKHGPLFIATVEGAQVGYDRIAMGC